MPVYTIAGVAAPPAGAAPSLLFHKFHAYDRFEEEEKIGRTGRTTRLKAFATDESRRPFLEAVAKASAAAQDRYAPWHKAFEKAVEGLGPGKVVTGTTAWRLITGWSTNPALEGGGLTLHPLLGFPYLPGSGVKGLLRRVAETEWAERAAASGLAEPGEGPLPHEPPPPLREAAAAAAVLRDTFGACVEDEGYLALPEPWRALVAWSRRLALPAPLPPSWEELRALLSPVVEGPHTGGRLRCFDAVPAPAAMKEGSLPLLEPDVLTPHYKAYYEGTSAPVDTIGPNPVLFLAVRPGVAFEFRFGVRAGTADDLAKKLFSDAHRWLVRGLTELGAGAKTSAGYGYFLGGAANAAAEAAAPQAAMPLAAEPGAARPPEETWLPESLDKSSLAEAIDRAAKENPPLDEGLRRAIAGRVLATYGVTVQQWRDRPVKTPAIRARLAWLDANAAEDGQ